MKGMLINLVFIVSFIITKKTYCCFSLVELKIKYTTTIAFYSLCRMTVFIYFWFSYFFTILASVDATMHINQWIMSYTCIKSYFSGYHFCDQLVYYSCILLFNSFCTCMKMNTLVILRMIRFYSSVHIRHKILWSCHKVETPLNY